MAQNNQFNRLMQNTSHRCQKKLYGVYSVYNFINYQSPLSNFVSLAPAPKLPLSSVIQYRQLGLILVSFFKESAYWHSCVQMSSA